MTLKIALPIVALALLTASPALAAEKFADCTVAERDTPTLDRAKLPDARFRMVVSNIGFERGPNGEEIRLMLAHGEERATLSDDVLLTVRLGGCEQYLNAYEFQFAGDGTPLNDNEYWLSKASGLITEVAPANRDRAVRLPDLSAALALAAKTSRDDLTKGLEGNLDQTSRYVLSLSRQGSTTVLTVGYFIAM